MQQGALRTVVGAVAAIWFLVAALNLGVGYPVSVGEPSFISDTVARAIVDLGRILLVGLAILSVSIVDVAWLRGLVARSGQ